MRLHYRIAGRLGYDLMPRRKNHVLLQPHLDKVLDRHRINCLIDVGANVGQYAAMVRESGYEGFIFSFEPVPSVHEVLHTRAGSDPRWKTFNFALGEKEEKLLLNVPELTEFSSFLQLNSFGRERFNIEAEGEEEVEVEVKRLDWILRDLVQDVSEPRVFLKMDTQGYDLEVFKGCRECRKSICGLQSEVSLKPIYEDVPDFLSVLGTYLDAGFEITGLFPVTRDKTSLAVIEYDCVMVRSS